jgi:hypothetical protein
MKRFLIYPGLMDMLVVALIVYLFSGVDVLLAVSYISIIAVIRLIFYVAFSGSDLRISEKRMIIKLLLFLMPVPYVLLRIPVVDWRTIIALYVSISTVLEFILVALKFYYTRRFK